jgi:hypothetical protein
MTKFNLTKIERDDMIAAMKAAGNTQFDLQKPSYLPDDLDEATTNEASIEIEIEDESSLLLGHIRGAENGERWTEAADYEPYEPNPYDGTYSEM